MITYTIDLNQVELMLKGHCHGVSVQRTKIGE